jgi:hypothetical protein
MVLLTSLPDKTKRKIIAEIVTSNIRFSNKEIGCGLGAFKDKLDDLFLASLKTPTLDFDNRTIKLAILTKHLGVEIATDETVLDLLFTRPMERELAMLFALALISSKDKVKKGLGI